VGLFCFFFSLYLFLIFSFVLLKPTPHAQQQGNDNNNKRRGVHQEEVTMGGIKFHRHPCHALINYTPFSNLGGLIHFGGLGVFY
jgi:hypothetical protein